MSLSFTAETRDSLSNLAASLNAGKDKAAGDAFFLFGLDRSQTEAMYRGDWLARKVVDIVPYDMVREWREWSGDRASVQAAEAAERRFGLRKLVQRALVLGRLYGGAALIVGTGETRPEALAAELHPEDVRPGDIKFLHVVNRWQLSVPGLECDPLSPWFGEPAFYEIVAPTRGALRLHPSRVLRFLGNELPDPMLGLSVWSDSILQTLYDAIHAVALMTTGATSLMHEAKVDVVTVPNLSEHLSSAATTAQLSARFAYAAAMKSINNLLLLGDGESWSRQRIDFAGLPEMVRTVLQVAAGAADIPVTRLLGQSPAGMSATGDSDTRNYYDMVSARQELDLRPQLERLDRLLLRSAGVDPASLSFGFRPLWQMDAAAKVAMALQKAQATQIYVGLNLWPATTTARLVEAQIAEDGTYPGAEGAFVEAPAIAPQPTTDFDPSQPRDPDGRWSGGGGAAGSSSPISVSGLPRQSTKVAPASASYSSPDFTTSTEASVSLPHGILSILSALNPVATAQAKELNPEHGHQGLAKPDTSDPSFAAWSSAISGVMVAQAAGPLLPGGVVQAPLQGTDPLDPASMNTSAPSVQEQQALVAALNLIQHGSTGGLNPHAYQNRPDPTTGALLPLSTGGYTTYDVPMGGPSRGATRVIVDNKTLQIYYNNTHYQSFFYIIISKH